MPAQHAAKLFGKSPACSGNGFVRRLGPVQIKEADRARFAAEPMNRALQDSRRVPVDGQNAPCERACVVADLDP